MTDRQSGRPATRAASWGRLVVALVVACVLLALPGLAATSTGARTLRDLGLGREQPDLFAVSFGNPDAVRTFVRSDGRVTAQFTVASARPEAAAYDWSLVAVPRGTRAGQPEKTLRTGAVALAPGQQRTVRVAGVLDCASRVRVEVRVASKGLKERVIHFWAAPTRKSGCTSAPRGT